MVAVRADEFVMGESAGDKFANDTERPAHAVRFRDGFVLGKFPVTVGEFRQFQPDHSPEDENDLPVVNVTWRDAVAYCDWLSGGSDHKYRLPSEAEWEFACRGGSTGLFSGGADITVADANFLYDENGAKIGIGRRTTVGRYAANRFGFYDFHGNVCEWVTDTWHKNYADAPKDGLPWVQSEDRRRVIRGGAWDYLPRLLRCSWRDWRNEDFYADNLGFRIAADEIGDLKDE